MTKSFECMIKKLAILLLFIISLSNGYAQSKNNIEDIFKMHLFLNKKNSIYRNMDSSIVKNDSLYKVFREILNLKITMLKVENRLMGFLEENYNFYKLSEEGITYNRELKKNEHSYLPEVMINSYFVLAVNISTGASYRLAGFDTNDFMNFLSDIKENYLNGNMKRLKTKYFLNNYKVEDLNFKCLYEGLTKEEIDRNKYPCLERCSEPLRIS